METRTRLNVVFNGKRTTARFPPELWRLYVDAVGSEAEAISELRDSLIKSKTYYGINWTASDSARAFMTGYVSCTLKVHGRLMGRC